MIETVLASIVGALASGALAKLKDVGGKAVLDSYNALKNLIVHKLGGDDTPVKAVEQKPGSPATTEYLAATLGEKRLAKGDADELEQLAQKLLVELGKVKAPETGIDVHHIVAQATATVRKLVTDGRISVSDVSGQDVTIEDLTSKKNQL